jgi:hypothetical protein
MMNPRLKFGIGVASTILAGVVAVNIRSIANSISDIFSVLPINEIHTFNRSFSARLGTIDLPTKTQAVSVGDRSRC